MTVTAFALPGLNSLLNAKARFRFARVPEVRERVGQAREFLGMAYGRSAAAEFESLPGLSNEKLYDRDRVSLTAAWIVAVQVGVAERVCRHAGAPNWVIGCSLGDIARTVLAGCCAFDDALRIPMISPQSEPGIDRVGQNVALLAPASCSFGPAEIGAIEALGIDVCMLSPRLLNVSGKFEDLPALERLAAERRWRFLPLLGYPVHSRHLEPFLSRFSRELEPIRFRSPGPRTRVYSTLLRREILRGEEFRPELERNLILTHHWHESVQRLVRENGVRRFINIGPCRTLSKLLCESGVEVLEPEDLI